jgi:hypothetical protein
MIKFSTTAGSTTHIVKPGDPKFTFSHDGITLSRRAGIEIDNHCPNEHRYIIQQCIEQGWIKPFAVLKDHEYMWDTLHHG